MGGGQSTLFRYRPDGRGRGRRALRVGDRRDRHAAVLGKPFWRLFAGSTGRLAGRPDATVIVPNLLVGTFPTPDDTAWLRDTYGITAIVNLQDDGDLASKGLDLVELERSYQEHGLQFHRVPVPDGDTEILALRLDQILRLLDDLLGGGECVYLHCNAGLNRAPTVAIAYLHAIRRVPLIEARDFVKQRRHCVPYMRLLAARYLAPGAEL